MVDVLLADLPEGPEYRAVEGFPKYVVGSDGSVWRSRSHGWYRLKQSPMKKVPYRVVGFTCRGGGRRTVSVHRLVLETFVGPCPDGMEGCHFPDRNPANNRVENLRWGTRLENAADKIKHGTQARLPGEKNPASKLTGEQVDEIRRRRKAGETLTSIAKDFGIIFQQVSLIALGKSWSHRADPTDERLEVREARLASLEAAK